MGIWLKGESAIIEGKFSKWDVEFRALKPERAAKLRAIGGRPLAVGDVEFIGS